jgi:hypothetical protein
VSPLQQRVGFSKRGVCFLLNGQRALGRRGTGFAPSQRRASQPEVRAIPARSRPSEDAGGNPMLWTIFVILLVLWLLGMVSSYTLGGFIHLLLILAIGMLLINVIQGRRIT